MWQEDAVLQLYWWVYWRLQEELFIQPVPSSHPSLSLQETITTEQDLFHLSEVLKNLKWVHMPFQGNGAWTNVGIWVGENPGTWKTSVMMKVQSNIQLPSVTSVTYQFWPSHSWQNPLFNSFTLWLFLTHWTIRNAQYIRAIYIIIRHC